MAHENERANTIRYAALMAVVQHLYVSVYAMQELNETEIEDALASFRDTARTLPWPSDDPAQSAFVAGEFEDAINLFVSGLRWRLVDKGILPKS